MCYRKSNVSSNSKRDKSSKTFLIFSINFTFPNDTKKCFDKNISGSVFTICLYFCITVCLCIYVYVVVFVSISIYKTNTIILRFIGSIHQFELFWHLSFFENWNVTYKKMFRLLHGCFFVDTSKHVERRAVDYWRILSLHLAKSKQTSKKVSSSREIWKEQEKECRLGAHRDLQEHDRDRQEVAQVDEKIWRTKVYFSTMKKCLNNWKWMTEFWKWIL